MNEIDRDVRYHVYRHFVTTGRAPSVDTLAERLEISNSGITDALLRLESAHALVLAPGSRNIWMAHPFSAVPTVYPVKTSGLSYWANCAWDALAIPTLLGVNGDTVTQCPDCAEPLTITTRGGELAPTDAVVHFAVPPRRFWENVGFT